MLCKAKIQTRDGILQRSINVRTCSQFSNPEKVAVRRARAERLLQADTSDGRSHAIIANTQSMSDNVMAYLLRIETMYRGIRHLREGSKLLALDWNERDFGIPHK